MPEYGQRREYNPDYRVEFGIMCDCSVQLKELNKSKNVLVALTINDRAHVRCWMLCRHDSSTFSLLLASCSEGIVLSGY